MTIPSLLQKYQRELSTFFEKVDLSALEGLLTLLKACQGLLIFSGVGKSAIIAEKISVTLTSTGTRALFLSPLDAMHGDVGVVSENDLFIALSKSGESDELLHLIPFIRNKGAKIIAITCNEKSRLAKAADYQVALPVQHELCPYNMAPTISTTIQMILGDVMAVALMEERGFTLDQYAMNHPAGTIGKRITVRVSDLMLKPPHVPLCSPDALLIDTLVELSDKKAGCVLGIDQVGGLLGIFTDGDLRRALQSKGPDVLKLPMKELLIKSPRFTRPDLLAFDALKIMENQQKSPVTVLPVLDEKGKVLGLIKMHDILQTGI